MGNFSQPLARSVFAQIKMIDPLTIIRPAIPLPSSAYYTPRARYRADTIISYLSRHIGADTVIIGITDQDISTSKGKIPDWGVMGLGYCPGNACVVSTFRLSQKNLSSQFYKVAVHELGHTQGLPHCPEKTCFMRDAEGGNPVNEETGFCQSCKSFLKNKGWNLK
jgi:archaemetzincin